MFVLKVIKNLKELFGVKRYKQRQYEKSVISKTHYVVTIYLLTEYSELYNCT